MINWFRKRLRPDTASIQQSHPQPERQTSPSEQPNYEWIGGRRRAAGVTYMLPNDLQEINRLDFQHYLLRYMLKGNYLAPLTAPANILDVGCGTGRWITEMAQSFPQANFMGIDLTPVEPSVTFPRNSHLLQGNVLDGLPFVDQSFNYVHQRLLLLGIPASRWPSLLQELARVTRSGGWIELVDVDLTAHHIGPQTKQLAKWVYEMSQERGTDPSLPTKLGRFLQDINLKNITSRTITIPIGNWGGRAGTMMLTNMHSVITATKPLITAYANITAEEYEHITEAVLREYEQFHSYSKFYIAYGQRAD